MGVGQTICLVLRSALRLITSKTPLVVLGSTLTFFRGFPGVSKLGLLGLSRLTSLGAWGVLNPWLPQPLAGSALLGSPESCSRPWAVAAGDSLNRPEGSGAVAGSALPQERSCSRPRPPHFPGMVSEGLRALRGRPLLLAFRTVIPALSLLRQDGACNCFRRCRAPPRFS